MSFPFTNFHRCKDFLWEVIPGSQSEGKRRKDSKGCVDELVAPVDKQGSGGLWGPPPRVAPPPGEESGEFICQLPSLIDGGWLLGPLHPVQPARLHGWSINPEAENAPQAKTSGQGSGSWQVQPLTLPHLLN